MTGNVSTILTLAVYCYVTGFHLIDEHFGVGGGRERRIGGRTYFFYILHQFLLSRERWLKGIIKSFPYVQDCS